MKPNKKAFTTLELALVTIIIGLIITIGAVSFVPILQNYRLIQTKNYIEQLKQYIINYAITQKYLPDDTKKITDLRIPVDPTTRRPIDYWREEIIYTSASDLVFKHNQSNPSPIDLLDICQKNKTNLRVKICSDPNCSQVSQEIRDVAFVLISKGKNLVQQADTIIDPTNSEVRLYSPGIYKNNIEYDDIATFVTLNELRAQLNCNTIQGAPLRIVTDYLPDGIQNYDYNAEITIEGGTPNPNNNSDPYQFTVTYNNTNVTSINGLEFKFKNRKLTIEGKPICSGTYNFLLTVTDMAQQNAYKNFALTIHPRQLRISPDNNLFVAQLNSYFTQNLFITGGSGSYTRQSCSGSCLGLSLDCPQSGLENQFRINLAGTPTSTGSCPFTISYKDSCDRVVTKSFTVEVQAGAPTACPQLGLSPESGTIWTAPLGQAFNQTITLSGGQQPTVNTACSISGNCSGLTMQCNNNSATITGTPNQSGICDISVSWRDSCTNPQQQTISGNYTIRIPCPQMQITRSSGYTFEVYERYPITDVRVGVSGGSGTRQCTQRSLNCVDPNLDISYCDGSGIEIFGTPRRTDDPVTCTFSATWADSCPFGSQSISGSYNIFIKPYPKAIVNTSPSQIYLKLSTTGNCEILPTNGCRIIDYGTTVYIYRAANCNENPPPCTYTYQALRNEDQDGDNHVQFELRGTSCILQDYFAFYPCF